MSVSARARVLLGIALLVGALALLPAVARAVNYSYPATYSGSTDVGGTVSFDTSADGAAVTRFFVAGLQSLCGLEEATTTGNVPISGEAFSYSTHATGVSFSGSFPAPQQAKGSLSVRFLGFPSCTSPTVGWTATTSVPPRDETPPQTKIKAGPKGDTRSRKATFKFSSSEPGSKFQCKLDAKAWSSCRSPKTYKSLKPGKHTFKVRARDAAGNTDQSPAKRSWHVESRG